MILFFLYNNSKNEYSHFIINPNTLQKIPICSDEGKKLMREYMKYYFEDFLKNTHKDWNYILPTELHKENLLKYYLLDVRKPKDYKKGHIKGSINIFWKDLISLKNINKLPKNKEIIIICYVGHTASQVLVMLKLLGYKAKVLKFGMGESPSKEVPVAGWNKYGFEII
jgi:rhodanese-related sulfurtransferase